jgi:hypothetical protein
MNYYLVMQIGTNIQSAVAYVYQIPPPDQREEQKNLIAKPKKRVLN